MGYIYKRGSTWWIGYFVGHIERRESAKTRDKTEAERLLKIREGEAAQFGVERIDARKVTLDKLLEHVVTDYEQNQFDTVKDVRRRLDIHIRPYFGRSIKAADVTTLHIKSFIAVMQKQKRKGSKRVGYSNAEINRNLAIIKRAFNLAHESGLPLLPPHIPTLEEDNARQIFVKYEELQSILTHMRNRGAKYFDVADAIEAGYITGWRINSEIITLEWNRVDFNGNWITVLKTKNGKPRSFYMTERLRDILLERRRITDELERLQRRIIPYVFHRNGRPIKRFDKSWKTSCAATGNAGKVPHDCRRSAVRNLVRSGVPEKIAQKVTGHLSRAVFDRYDITEEADRMEATRKLEQKMEEYSQFTHNLPAAAIRKFRK